MNTLKPMTNKFSVRASAAFAFNPGNKSPRALSRGNTLLSPSPVSPSSGNKSPTTDPNVLQVKAPSVFDFSSEMTSPSH